MSLKVERGQALGLVGDNGTGKSTLINILSGLHHPGDGEVLVEGQQTNIRNPKDALGLGIETIYHYNSVVPLMTISRNVFIGREPLKWSIGGFGEEDVRGLGQGHSGCRIASALTRRLGG